MPETITPEYVNDVLAALNHVYGEVFRKYLATGTLEAQDLVQLQTIFYDEELDEQGAALARTPRLAADKYAEPIGDRRIVVVELLTASDDCIAAEVTYDFSAVIREPPPMGRGWLSLRMKEADSDPSGLNPTPWSIATESLMMENKCERP